MGLGGLLLIGAVLGGLWWLQNGGARGQGELIAADKGDYKVQPTDNAARVFEGEGDASFAASEGAAPTGRVDPSRMPEAPAVTPQPRAAAAKAAPAKAKAAVAPAKAARSEEHTSELQSLMRISYAVFCLKKKKTQIKHMHESITQQIGTTTPPQQTA